ncbi:MAG: tol-pal system protein YbgF [Rhizobiaceae bacterium]|nr:tol-pal system protein YbgF [Rhizobiaceae bacterium]
MKKTMSLVAVFTVLSFGLVGGNGGNVALAQSADSAYRVNELEEQVRQLNGRVEDLNFQLLEMQELVRKMQQDNEFRFQELEDQGNAGGGAAKKRSTIGDLIKPSKSGLPSDLPEGEKRLGKPRPSERTASVVSPDGNAIKASREPRMIDGVEIYDGSQDEAGTIAKSLGTITFDANGNYIEDTIAGPIDLTKRLYGGSDSNVRLAVPQDADELYSLGYSYIQSGDYSLAEESFADFLLRFPEHAKVPDVNFWLGESHFARGQYRKSARIFLNSHRSWPNARLAPQTLLKLGVSVAGLNQRELACATYAEVGQKYPDSSIIVKRNVKVEQRAARCSVN